MMSGMVKAVVSLLSASTVLLASAQQDTTWPVAFVVSGEYDRGSTNTILAELGQYDGRYEHVEATHCNGKPVYRLGGEGGPVLFQPGGGSTWVVGGTGCASSCRADGLLMISSGESCAQRPDGEDCAGSWREYDGHNWRDAPSLTVFTCPTDDPCCGMDCGDHGTLSGSGGQCRCLCSGDYSGTLCQLAPAYIVSGADNDNRNGRYERLPAAAGSCSGFPVYQKDGSEGLVLFQPDSQNEWMISSADHKSSCAATGYIHSGRGSCPLSPDGAGCAGRWMEYRRWRDELGWANIQSIAVERWCPANEPCCDVNCGSHGSVSGDGIATQCHCTCTDGYTGELCHIPFVPSPKPPPAPTTTPSPAPSPAPPTTPSSSMAVRPGCEDGKCAFCAGFRHADKRNRNAEFVSSAVSVSEKCECTDLAAVQHANVTTPSLKQCDPIVMCTLKGSSDVCICHELPYAVPAGVRTTTVFSAEDFCIHSDGSNGLTFGIEGISSGWQLAFMFCASGLCGFMVFTSKRDTSACRKEPGWFLMIEFLDASADVGSLIYSLAAHDLMFSNDDGLVQTVLTVSVVLSVAVFGFELYLHKFKTIVLQEWIPFLLCLHMVFEDFFQSFIYVWIGGTHFSASIQNESEVCDKGALCPGFAIATAIVQAIIFTGVKMWELWQEEAENSTDGTDIEARPGAGIASAEVVNCWDNPMVASGMHGGIAQAVVATHATNPQPRPVSSAPVVLPPGGEGVNPSRADVLSLARNVMGWNNERDVDGIIAQCDGDLKTAYRWLSEQAEQATSHNAAPAG